MNQLGSAGGNLHMSTVGWQFPSQNMLASSQSNGYVYPHPNVYGSGSDINQYVQNEDGYRAFTGPFANSLLFWHTDKSACGGP
jgi:hypothetical protein